uniref:X-ray repair cross complementing 2 n=1 Tax=Junco hyemalis TaxID=40217 RepID=A0A8C5IMK7_JUNHY
MEEKMSTYTLITESEISNRGFEIELGIFSKLFRLQGSLQGCCLSFCTLCVTKLGARDTHPQITLYMLGISPPHIPAEQEGRQNGKGSPGAEPGRLWLDWEQPVLSLCNVGRGEGCPCSVSAVLPSLVLLCGQTFVRAEGKLLPVCARNPVAPSVALMRQVPLEILLQNAEVNTSWIKTQLRARLEGRSSLKNLEPCLFAEEGSPVHGDVIEFHGPEGTGKTEMLYHLLARCIIAKAQGGLEVEVMFVDTDYHFDMLRLVTILENRLAQGTEEMIKQCLGRLFLVSCSSSTQLLLTLYSLENLFCAHPSLCVLILDSLSAFYWIDRSNGGESLTLQEMNLKKCANFLEKLVTQHHLILFATTQTLMQKSANSAEGFLPSKLPHETDTDYRPYLCKSWQQMVTHRMFFSKQCNSGNSKGFTVVSCHLKRNQIVKRSFSVAESGVQF